MKNNRIDLSNEFEKNKLLNSEVELTKKKKKI